MAWLSVKDKEKTSAFITGIVLQNIMIQISLWMT